MLLAITYGLWALNQGLKLYDELDRHIAKWLLESPDCITLKKLEKCLAEIDARLRVLARKEPDSSSNLARDVADELELPGNPMMLEFLTGAEALLSADGTAPEKIHELALRPAWNTRSWSRKRVQSVTSSDHRAL